MREKWQKQMPLLPAEVNHPQAIEMEVISRIIDSKPTICERVLQDLQRHGKPRHRCGAKAMSAEQVLRAAIVKMLFGFSYLELAFHMVDSRCIRRFCRIGIADKGFKKSVLNRHIKSIRSNTWQAIHRDLLDYANVNKIEKGRKVRIDSTVVETNIHTPSDSTLLFDAVRVITRLLGQTRDLVAHRFAYSDHRLRAKRRMLNIQYAKNVKQRRPAYRELVKLAGKCLGYAQQALDCLSTASSVKAMMLSLSLQHYIRLTQQVIDQTQRRVFDGESVPAIDKVVSIFEEHTDVIVKDRRDTYFGHKVCLAGGASNLILDCLVLRGNPPDSALVETMLDRQKNYYRRYPLKVALDGGFASKDNLKTAKGKQIKDVCFAKKRGLKETDMCRSHYVYKRLRRFRAGIESGISWLKRCFGFDRCTWKGWRSFNSYVWVSIIAANLLTMARKQPA